MKTLGKDILLEYEQVESTKLERDILLNIKHPFLCGMEYMFMTEEKIFFIMQFLRGGELFKHLRKDRQFTEERSKFYAVQVALALAHLHENNYVYRDLKPENILMDDKGYLCVADFGLARTIKPTELA